MEHYAILIEITFDILASKTVSRNQAHINLLLISATSALYGESKQQRNRPQLPRAQFFTPKAVTIWHLGAVT